jgi:MoaA/NifB/PqqE/SkfB family radical SAM enzyme
MRVVTQETHGELSCLNWHTLSDKRAAEVRPRQSIFRAAMIITGACNFECPYCKTLGGSRAPTIKQSDAFALLNKLVANGLKELRISGGEPTLVPWLPSFVAMAAKDGVRVAISTNGYADAEVYDALLAAGTAEFSISLDSADPEEADRLSGNKTGVLEKVKSTIRLIASRNVPVYVGMTCASGRSPEDMKQAIAMATDLGIAEVKIMSLAQEGDIVDVSWVDPEMAERFPLLQWRANNYRCGRDVRGLADDDCRKCALVLDDITVAGAKHYPCNVYFREGGDAIGTLDGDILADRARWFHNHDSQQDPICWAFCMDILRTYNNRVRDLNPDVGDRKRQAILRGRADVAAGRVTSHEKVKEWLNSWGTAHELPPPHKARDAEQQVTQGRVCRGIDLGNLGRDLRIPRFSSLWLYNRHRRTYTDRVRYALRLHQARMNRD